MAQMFTGPKGYAPQSSEGVPFARPSLQQYSSTIRDQAGLRNLAALQVAFRGDPGEDMPVRTRSTGTGYEFSESKALSDDQLRGAWLVFEKLPGDTIRARAFKTVEGASAEFSTRLLMQTQGDVTVRELQTQAEGQRGRHLQISFEGEGPQGRLAMLMAPISAALDQAARLFWA